MKIIFENKTFYW